MKVALVGNPNSGKSTLFNQLTGLTQKIGNFPGVTVEKKSGFLELPDLQKIELIDLPGTYSIYPKSYDEQVVLDVLTNPSDPAHPDLIIVTVDSSNLKRNLLLFSQIYDLGIPVILAANMMDVATQNGVEFDFALLEHNLNVRVVPMNARKSQGIQLLKKVLAEETYRIQRKHLPFFQMFPELELHLKEAAGRTGLRNVYQNLLLFHCPDAFQWMDPEIKQFVLSMKEKIGFKAIEYQAQETIARYQRINQIFSACIRETRSAHHTSFSSKADKILTHKFWGYGIFFLILFAMFQAVFSWASYPMDLIDGFTTQLIENIRAQWGSGLWVDLITNGLLAGLGGVLVFIPQISILFAFIAMLEESGYMSRVMFLTDKIMRKFGLNGKSIVPLISGVACAVPAIMAARSIGNYKERLVTIFVTPLISCSARIPVFTVMIALVIPDDRVLGFLNLQGLVLMGLYMLGFMVALFSSLLASKIVKAQDQSFFILEMPDYKPPRFKNVWVTISDKVKTFVLEAGKIILAISLVLWVLASFGPSEKQAKAVQQVQLEALNLQQSSEITERKIAAVRLETSYAGHFGKWLEPVIAPLGFDWKIGIALVTSFAAREVFVSTINTIYAIGAGDDDTETLKEKLSAQVDVQGKPFFNLARGLSIMVFYAFAMQCLSTIAVVKKETGSWVFTLIQLTYLTLLAYLASFTVYQTLV